MRNLMVALALAAVGCGDSGASIPDGGGANPDLANGGSTDLAGIDFAGVDLTSAGGGDGGPGGCTVFPVTAGCSSGECLWNADITGATVDSKSMAYLGSIGLATGMHADFDSVGDGIPFVIVPGNQALVPINFTAYPGESDPGPYPIPDNAPIEGGGDRHVIAVDLTNCFLYELYAGIKTAGGWSADNGAKWDLRSSALRPAGWTSADAAGLPIYPGLVRYDEVINQKVINHALRFTIEKTQMGYINPASHGAGSCTLNSSCPPMGLRVRLKPGTVITGYPASVQVILTALKKYGMIVADNAGTGSNWFISGEPNANWVDDDLSKISGIKGSDFEVLTTGTITPQ